MFFSSSSLIFSRFPHANLSIRLPDQVERNHPFQKRSHRLYPLCANSISHFGHLYFRHQSSCEGQKQHCQVRDMKAPLTKTRTCLGCSMFGIVREPPLFIEAASSFVRTKRPLLDFDRERYQPPSRLSCSSNRRPCAFNRLWTFPTSPPVDPCLALLLHQSTTVLLSPVIFNWIPLPSPGASRTFGSNSFVFLQGAPTVFFIECFVGCLVTFKRVIITSFFLGRVQYQFLHPDILLTSPSRPRPLLCDGSHLCFHPETSDPSCPKHFCSSTKS